MIERRKFPRFERPFEVRYSDPKKSILQNYTISKDISKSGIRIPCSGSIQNNDILNLDIDLNGGKPTLSAAGKVVWIRKSARPAVLDLEAGLEFINVVSKEIDAFIKNL